jgi:ABC-type multidrug transport system ATPase subunit
MNENEWIKYKQFSKRFNQYNKVGEITLSLKKGEIFALCGGNGAGKSTFIKTITGVMKATTGDIIVSGKSMKPKSMEYRELFSFMPDNMLFPPQLTGLEVLSFFAHLRKVESEKVPEMLELVGLYEARHRLIKHYSKGMQQRLSFAQALLPNSALVILDEPTNGLDPYWFFRFKEILQLEKDKGKTILLTTHILSLVEEIADQVAFMENGIIVENDTVKNLTSSNGQRISLEKVFFQHQMDEMEKSLS